MKIHLIQVGDHFNIYDTGGEEIGKVVKNVRVPMSVRDMIMVVELDNKQIERILLNEQPKERKQDGSGKQVQDE